MNARLHLRMRFPARTLMYAIRCAKRKLAPSRQFAAPERSKPPIPEKVAPIRPSAPLQSRSATSVVSAQNATSTPSAPATCSSQLELNACLELFAPIGFLPSNGE